MHFLIVDSRFAVPIFVFLEIDPNESSVHAPLPGSWVILERSLSFEVGTRKSMAGLGDTAAIGGDPKNPDRFAIFATEGDVRASGYALIEPRYLGPTWETYLSVFHPEGGKRSGGWNARPGDNRAIAKIIKHGQRVGPGV